MSENASPRDSASSSQSASGAAFLKLFGSGVMGWIVGSVLLFAVCWFAMKPVSLAAGVIWTIAHNWIGFLFGAVVLVGFGLMSGRFVGRAALAYLLPAVLLVGLSFLCLLVYPDYTLREDLLTYLPMVLIFYVLAFLWLWTRKGKADTSSFARAVIPACIGGLTILCFVAVPVFASDAFRYRDTFELKISTAEMKDGKFVADGSIEIRNPGHFVFSAPRYAWSPSAEDIEVELGAIVWGAAGEPKAGSSGVFPLQITWVKATQSREDIQFDLGEDAINMEIRNPAEGNKVIYFLNFPIPRPDAADGRPPGALDAPAAGVTGASDAPAPDGAGAPVKSEE